jgi:hypothetical protein
MYHLPDLYILNNHNIVTRLRAEVTGEWGIDSFFGQEIFLYSKVLKWAVGSS